MANVYLITGFNNWGKTHLINGLFSRKRFGKSDPFTFAGHDFCVVPQSNDDLGQKGYITAYQDRVRSLRERGHNVTHILSAFCPTREPTNDSLKIVGQLFRNDQVFLIPIEYKWCGHAKLQLKNLTTYFASAKNMQVHPLSQRNSGLALRDLKALMIPLL